jgi:HEAT repeat protein
MAEENPLLRALGRLFGWSPRRRIQGLIETMEYGRPTSARRQAREELAAIGARAVSALVETATLGSSRRARANALRILSEIRDPNAVRPLVAAITDPLGELNDAVVTSLSAIGSPAVTLLVAEFPTYGVARRLIAVRVLTRLRNEGLRQVLPTVLADTEPIVRHAGVEALLVLDRAFAVPCLVSALGDPDRNVRTTAVIGLGQSGDPRAIRALIELRGSSDRDLRARIDDALLVLRAPVVTLPAWGAEEVA